MEEKKRTEVNILPIINLILIVFIIGVIGYHFAEPGKSHKRLREEILSEIYLNTGARAYQFQREISGRVDFTEPRIQEIGRGFKLAKAAQAKHLNGIKFLGRMINTQSIKYTNISFRITVSNVSKEFTINQISAGNSTRFSVYVPDITIEDARFANIEYITSTMWYNTK